MAQMMFLTFAFYLTKLILKTLIDAVFDPPQNMLIILDLKFVNLGVTLISYMLIYFNVSIHLDERVKKKERERKNEDER